ncbi:MAG: 50S ribosomal protein L23 [Candidatus Curtissbacteria bacterium]|nr:50S ribosomal protein L23 [Candidatus Curtissbacteria bacterium]
MTNKNIVQKAILSEKAYGLMEKGIYTFMVEKHSTKEEIAKYVQNLFSVDVVNVNIASVKPKTKRVNKTKKFTKSGGGKKAIVTLKAGQKIAILSPKTASKKTKTSGKEKDVEIANIEGKEK